MEGFFGVCDEGDDVSAGAARRALRATLVGKFGGLPVESVEGVVGRAFAGGDRVDVSTFAEVAQRAARGLQLLEQ